MKTVLLGCCLTIGLFSVTGCIGTSVINASCAKTSIPTDNTNLFVKIEIEKDGSPVQYCSSIVSKNTITIYHSFKLDNDNAGLINMSLLGKNIRKLDENNYSMDYAAELKIPVLIVETSRGNEISRSRQYTTEGSISSLNITSDV